MPAGLQAGWRARSHVVLFSIQAPHQRQDSPPSYQPRDCRQKPPHLAEPGFLVRHMEKQSAGGHQLLLAVPRPFPLLWIIAPSFLWGNIPLPFAVHVGTQSRTGQSESGIWFREAHELSQSNRKCQVKGHFPFIWDWGTRAECLGSTPESEDN